MLARRKFDKQPAGATSIAKSGLTITATTCCVGFVLFAIAAIIVLSLIPLYLPQKFAQKSAALTQSEPVTMQINTGIPVGSRRKKRDDPSLLDVAQALGLKFGREDTQYVGTLLEKMFDGVSLDTTGVSMIDVLITATNTRRKRGTIQKRQGAFYVVETSFFINFLERCDSTCQDRAGALLEAAIPVRVTNESVVLNNVTVTDDHDNVIGIIDSIPVTDCAYLSSITATKPKKVKTTKAPTVSVTAKKKTTTTTTITKTLNTTTTRASTIGTGTTATIGTGTTATIGTGTTATVTTVTLLTTTILCTDTAGYYEPVTSHTCLTYTDYGFCNGTSIISPTQLNATAAQANCCACGKGTTQSSG